MENITTVKELISMWPSRAALAGDIRQETATVHKWAQFNRIPSKHQGEVLAAAKSRRFKGITAQWMIDAHAQKAVKS